MKIEGAVNQLDTMGKIITEYQDRLFRFAFFRTGSPADAQDIVQDVFVKLYRQKDHPSKIQNLTGYLFKSVANACTDFQKQKKKSRVDSLERTNSDNIPQGTDAGSSMLLKEEYSRVEKLLKQLPEDQAEAIRLRVLDEMSFTEMAGLLSLPVTTLKSRFKYGIDKLKNIVHPKKSFYEL